MLGLALLIRGKSRHCNTSLGSMSVLLLLPPETRFATHVKYLIGSESLQGLRTKVFSRFVKIVAEVEAIFAIDESASFMMDELVDAEESS